MKIILMKERNSLSCMVHIMPTKNLGVKDYICSIKLKSDQNLFTSSNKFGFFYVPNSSHVT